MKNFLIFFLLLTPILPFVWVAFHLLGGSDTIYVEEVFLPMFLTYISAKIFYLWHAVKNDRIDSGSKSVLIIALIVFSTPTQIYYWFRFRKQLV